MTRRAENLAIILARREGSHRLYSHEASGRWVGRRLTRWNLRRFSDEEIERLAEMMRREDEFNATFDPFAFEGDCSPPS